MQNEIMNNLPIKEYKRFYKEAETKESWNKVFKNFSKKVRKHGKRLGSDVRDKAIFLYDALKNPNVPKNYKLEIAACLLYFISPMDAIPDFIPIIGLTDDVAVILYTFKRLGDVIQVHVNSLTPLDVTVNDKNE